MKSPARLRVQSRPPAPDSSAMQELYRLLLQSEKFADWKPSWWDERLRSGDLEHSKVVKDVGQPHFTPDDLAAAWGVSAETIRNIFRDEPDVLRIAHPSGRKRKYVLMRIPESVAERVHRRLSAVAE
jgi:hypothetical protein